MSDLAEPRLVVPEGLIIDRSVRERLERQLASAPAAIGGVAAVMSELAPGASYRVHAEWMSLTTPASAAMAASTAVRGAVLLRPEIAFQVRDGIVEIAKGSALVDAGAHVHDPHGRIDRLQDASERGRPPFPRRPVVVFLGCEVGADTDWVRRLVNRLVRSDVEARIALPDVGPDGRGPDSAPPAHLTRPCLPSEVSIRALWPDVVVTLDDTAAARVDEWCAGNRSAVVVGFDRDLHVPMELVSWQIGRAHGRLRARIGPLVDVPAFASLVVRLCAGPQPIPPSDDKILVDARKPVRERWSNSETSVSTPDCVVLTGALDAAARARVDGLVDNLAAARVPVVCAPVAGGVPAEAAKAALVLLVRIALPEIEALITARRQAGLPTVADLGPDALEPSAKGLEPRLTEAAAALGAACGRVVTADGVLHAAAQGLGVRALMLPTLLTRERAASLRAARVPIDPMARRVVGWYLPDAGSRVAGPAYADAVAAGIAGAWMDSHDVILLVGDAATVPGALVGHERVTVVPETALDLDALAKWTLHVWTPPLFGGRVADDLRRFEEVSYLGVPSVMPAAASSAVDGFVSPNVLVESMKRPEEWTDVLGHLIGDEGRRALRAQEALRRAESINDPSAAKAVANRFFGWAQYPAENLEWVTA